MRAFVFLRVLCTLFFLGSVAARSGEGLVARQDTTAADAATTGDAATAAETASATDADSNSNSNAQTETGSNSKTSDSSSSSSSTSIDPRMGAGGVSMLTPTQGASAYYKIGGNVTFGWKYTSLAVTPSAINVVASCSLNEGTYTISSNMSVEETGKAVWDTGSYQANATVPLLTATYTLYVYDAEKEMGDTAEAGHLGSLNQFTFGMYVPKSYTPLNEYNCATCNSALSELDHHAVRFAMGMVTITVLSFTWFAGSYGVFAT